MTGSGLYHALIGEWEPPKLSNAEKSAFESGFDAGLKAGLELPAKVDSATKKSKRGRPKKGAFGSIDCFRAFTIWNTIQLLPRLNLRSKSNRELIEIVRKLEELAAIPEQTFKLANNYEASVARGRTELQIDKNWNSRLCEKIKDNFSQTTANSQLGNQEAP